MHTIKKAWGRLLSYRRREDMPQTTLPETLKKARETIEKARETLGMAEETLQKMLVIASEGQEKPDAPPETNHRRIHRKRRRRRRLVR